MRMLAFIWSIAAIVMIFIAVFAPGHAQTRRPGLSTSGYAAVYAVIFGVAAVVCYFIAYYGELS